jgi:hypothetical protein
MFSIHQLMLKDTPYNEILHSKKITNIEELIDLAEALDFVIEAWRCNMNSFNVENADEVAAEALGAIFTIRMLLFDPSSSYLEMVRQCKRLRSSFFKLAKSYTRTPAVSKWYASLPEKIIQSYNYVFLASNDRAVHK